MLKYPKCALSSFRFFHAKRPVFSLIDLSSVFEMFHAICCKRMIDMAWLIWRLYVSVHFRSYFKIYWYNMIRVKIRINILILVSKALYTNYIVSAKIKITKYVFFGLHFPHKLSLDLCYILSSVPRKASKNNILKLKASFYYLNSRFLKHKILRAL